MDLATGRTATTFTAEMPLAGFAFLTAGNDGPIRSEANIATLAAVTTSGT